MAQQTAVDFLVNELESILELYNSEWDEVYKAAEQAKAMEKEKIIRFAISCHQDILRDRNVSENLISENLLLFEKYYNENYNK